MSAPPLQDQPLASMAAASAAQGNAVAYPKRGSQMLSQSRLISDGTAHHFLLCAPSEAVDLTAVQRQCSASSPKGADEVLMYHVAVPGGSSRRVLAVTVPVSLAASSVIAMELLKKRLFIWEDELNATFSGMNEDEASAIPTDGGSARHQAVSSSSSSAHAGSQQQVPSAAGNPAEGATSSVSGVPPRAQPAPSNPAPSSGGQRPTLFNLLEALASDSVTTPEQRNSIRGIVTDFLNHDLPHSKVYSFIGAVVGHDVLHTIVRRLENEPGRLGVPDAGGLARIEKAFGLSKTTNPQPSHTPHASGRRLFHCSHCGRGISLGEL